MQNQLDIDQSTFDPQKYVTHYLKNNSIQDLFSKNNEVQNEVKNFDQEIQSLVFENYTKFISSIDTVKKMKNDIFKVDDKMKILEKSMQKISKLTTTIDDSLKTKREEIKKLETVNTDLQKLNTLCEFPQVIEKDLIEFKELKQKNQDIDFEIIFNKSIEVYEQCFQMLSQFREEPLVKPIYADSIDKVDEIRSILWNSQNQLKFNRSLSTEISEINENTTDNQQNDEGARDSNQLKSITKKLIIITEDQESVLRNYLKIVKDKMLHNVKIILDYKNSSEDLKEITSVDSQVYLAFKEKDFISTLQEVSEIKKQIEQEHIQKQLNIQGSLIWFLQKLEKIVFQDLQREIDFLLKDIEPHINENKQCQDLIDNTLKDIVMGILGNIQQNLNEMSSVSNIDINKSFQIINNNIVDIILKNDLVNRTLKSEVQQKFNETIESICKGQVLKGFNNLRINVIETVIEAKKECLEFQQEHKLEKVIEDQVQVETDLKKKVFQILTVFKNKINSYFQFILLDMSTLIFDQNYLPNPHHFLSLLFAQTLDFSKALIRILVYSKYQISQELLEFINAAIVNKQHASSFLLEQQNQILELDFMRVFEEFKKVEQSSMFYLVSNQYLQLYKQNIIGTIFQNLNEVTKNNIPKIVEFEPSITQYYNQFSNTLQNAEIPKVITLLNGQVLKNMINFSQYRAQHLIKQYFANYIKIILPSINSQPVDVSEITENFAYNLKTILVELSILFPDMKRGMSKKGSFLKQESEFDADMQIMLVKKLHNYSRIAEEPNRHFVLTSIINTFLKSFGELIRLQLKKLSKDGYTQLYMDFYFIIQLIYETVQVDDENIIISFFFEIVDNSTKLIQNDQIPSKSYLQNLIEPIFQAKRLKLKI